MTLHPTSGKLEALSSTSVQPSLLFKLTHDPEFMTHVALAACGYRVEEKELPSLPPSLQDLLKEGASLSTVESQFKAMELLSWMVGVHLTNTNRCVCVCETVCVSVCVSVGLCVCVTSAQYDLMPCYSSIMCVLSH